MGNECSQGIYCWNEVRDRILSDILFDTSDFDSKNNSAMRRYRDQKECCNQWKRSLNFDDWGLSDGSGSLWEWYRNDVKIYSYKHGPEDFSFAINSSPEKFQINKLVENIVLKAKEQRKLIMTQSNKKSPQRDQVYSSNDEVVYNDRESSKFETPKKDNDDRGAAYSFEMQNDSLNIQQQSIDANIEVPPKKNTGSFDISLIQDYQHIVKRYEALKSRTESKATATKASEGVFDYKARSGNNIDFETEVKGKSYITSLD